MLLEFTRVTSNFPHQLSQISFIGFTNLTKYDFNFLQTSYVRFHIVLPLTLRNPQRGMSTLPNEPFRNTAMTITKVDKSSKIWFLLFTSQQHQLWVQLSSSRTPKFIILTRKKQVPSFEIHDFNFEDLHTFPFSYICDERTPVLFKYFQLWCAFPGFHSTKTLLILKMLNAVVLLMDNG